METSIDKIDTPNAQENNPGNCPQSNPLSSMENIQKMPPEVLAEVFSYLTHTEKLISRLVCTDWNREISSILANVSYFTLTTVGGRDVILDSEVPWAKIKISDSHELALSTKTRSFVTTIALEVSGSDMKEIMTMRILSKFPQLIDLEVNVLGGGESGELTKREDSVLACEQFEVLRNQFRERVAKLKILTITLESLTNFFDEAKCLIKLTLREKSPSDSELANEDNSRNCSMTAVSNTILKSSRTLKYLELKLVSKIRNKLFTDLISKLSLLEDLELECFLIHWNPAHLIPETSFEIHQKFLKAQIAKGYMKSLSLPWCSNVSLCQEFVRSLPENIKLVGNVSKEHMSNEFHSTFSNCGNMAIRWGNASVRFHRTRSSKQQFQYWTKDDDDEPDYRFWHQVEFYKDLGNPLIHVTALQFYAVRTEWSTFSERDLQHIIENFQQLRILEIRLGSSDITDYSICGIEQEYADELKHTKNLYLNLNVPDENRSGRPLSSLKCLEKLLLHGTSVTDVGIYYGLRFGSTLKHLTFETYQKISDWGLHWLGAGNPSLESFDCTFLTGKITSDGVKKLRKQFPMIEATGKFKLLVKI